MNIDPNSPAFPTARENENPSGPGMTIRAHFAAMAMQGLLAGYCSRANKGDDGALLLHESIFTTSVNAADALIAALNKEGK